MIVIADTAPLHYLILIGKVDLLSALYGQVFIPEAVRDELSVSAAPARVARWLSTPPAWLQIQSVAEERVHEISAELDRGERDVIALAKHLQADLILIDDEAGRAEARKSSLRVTGTLGVLRVAAERGLIDVPEVLARLRDTNFYVGEHLIRSIFGPWLK